MYRLGLDPGFADLIEILVPQYQRHFAIGVDHQQGFFKAGEKADQIFKIATVLDITVNHQLIKPTLLHPAKDVALSLLDGFIR
ncbi:hypothetical protein D3C78_1395810 [compost metagenome]